MSTTSIDDEIWEDIMNYDSNDEDENEDTEVNVVQSRNQYCPDIP